MPNVEKALASEILHAGGSAPSRLGLRFDRVVVGVLADLRSFVEASPGNLAVVVTISAPIRLPAKTADDLKASISALLKAGSAPVERIAILHGNAVRIRLFEQPARAKARLVGFVHHPESAPETLFDLTERWLRAQV